MAGDAVPSAQVPAPSGGAADGRIPFKLVFEAGERRGQVRDFLQRAVTLGRASTCDVILGDPVLTALQAEIRCHEGSCYLVPRGFNAIRLNDRELEGGLEIFDGDRFELPGGNVILFVETAKLGQDSETEELRPRRLLPVDETRMVFGAEQGIPWALKLVRGPWEAPPGHVMAYFERAVVRIGRSRDNDLVLDDPQVSRRQLVVRCTDGKLVADGQGLVPCLVGGQPMRERQELADGDRIGFSPDIELQVALGLTRPRAAAVTVPGPAPDAPPKKSSDLWLYGGVSSLLCTVFFLLMAFVPDPEGPGPRARLETMPEEELAWLIVESFGDEFFEPTAEEATVTRNGLRRFGGPERWTLRARRTPLSLRGRAPRSVGELRLKARYVLSSANVSSGAYRDGFRLLYEAAARAPRGDRPGVLRDLDTLAKPYVEQLAALLFDAKVQRKESDLARATGNYERIRALVRTELNPGYRVASVMMQKIRQEPPEKPTTDATAPAAK